MTVQGIRQCNMFGGDDPIDEGWEKRLKELTSEPKKEVCVKLTVEVPSSLDDDDIYDWLAFSIGESCSYSCDTDIREALSRIEPEVIAFNVE